MCECDWNVNKEDYDKMIELLELLNKEIIAELDDDISELRRLGKEAKKELMNK